MPQQRSFLESLYRRTVVALTENVARTSEDAEFDELRPRHYKARLNEVYDAILKKVDIWIGWEAANKEKSLGNMAIIKCKVPSLLLVGTTCQVDIWLNEIKRDDGAYETVMNAKCSCGNFLNVDLGESQRMITMVVFALDEMFEQYHPSVYTAGSTSFSNPPDAIGAKPKKDGKITVHMKPPATKEGSPQTNGSSKTDNVNPVTGSREIKVNLTSKTKNNDAK